MWNKRAAILWFCKRVQKVITLHGWVATAAFTSLTFSSAFLSFLGSDENGDMRKVLIDKALTSGFYDFNSFFPAFSCFYITHLSSIFFSFLGSDECFDDVCAQGGYDEGPRR